MNPNKIKNRIKAGECVYGTFVKIDDPSVVEVLALAGLDFFVLDNEHVALDRGRMTNMIRAAEAFDITPLIRVRENRRVEILQNLDLGYAGVQVPNVDTAGQARELVEAVKYSPLGSRGFSPSVRACRYGTMNIPAYIEAANEHTLIVAHCETKTCVDNLDEILAVPGLDVLFIGPMDLSQSLGVTGDTGSALVKETVAAIMAKVRTTEVAIGTVAANAVTAKALADQGVKYILIGSDQSMILNWAKAVMTEIRAGSK